MQIKLTQSLKITFLLLLSACGGGGNSSSNDSGTGQVQNMPVITTQPANLHVTIGSQAKFEVIATGGSNLQYQWLRDGNKIGGANSATLIINSVQAKDANSKWNVIVQNNAGTVTSKDSILKITGIEVIAGSPFANNFPRTTKFFNSIAVDSENNTYITDITNQQILKVTPDGVLTSFAGNKTYGYKDGFRQNASFANPSGLAFDLNGNLLIADRGNHVIRKIDLSGNVTTIAGVAGISGSKDGIMSASNFSEPNSLTVDQNGNIFVADTGNSTIRKISPDGFVSTFAGSAMERNFINGNGKNARLNQPTRIISDKLGNLFFLETFGLVIRKINANADVSLFAGDLSRYGHLDGHVSQASFSAISDITIDNQGVIYLTDIKDHAIRQISKQGIVSTLSGSYNTKFTEDGIGMNAHFNSPKNIVSSSNGNLTILEQISDLNKANLRTMSNQGVVMTLMGSDAGSGFNDGKSENARFSSLMGVARSSNGKVFVVDSGNNAIREIDASGFVRTFAGGSISEETKDGIGTEATFSGLTALAIDARDNIFVSNTSKNNIRKITTDKVVTSFAGEPSFFGGYLDGLGLNAKFARIMGLAINDQGDLLISDTGNNSIRKSSPNGLVTTIAGQKLKLGSVDGSLFLANFGKPSGIITNSSGTTYIADSFSHVIRKISPDGQVTTIAGTPGVAGNKDGLGFNASFNNPNGLALDKNNNLYVVDTNNHLIRKISPEGNVTTIVGSINSIGNKVGALPGSLSYPQYISIDENNFLYVTSAHAIFRILL